MSAKRVYDFGPFRLDPTERRLLRHDQPVALTPKCFDLLVILVENSGHLISKEELLERLWPDQFVEESNLSFNISTLRKALGEAGHGDHFIETVPKKGFRFVAHVDLREDDEIDVSRIRQETLTSTNVQPDIVPAYSSAPARFGPKVRIIAGIFCALAVVIICYGIWFRRVDAPTRNSPRTIAVLPFKPLSPESRNESLEMGMAEALITRLSNINQLVVRPLSSVRKYGDVQQDPIKAGQEVEADAVLDGSIQRVGDRMRVTVRLIDVRTGATILSEPFDAQFSDIFNLQDSISQRMTKALSLKLTGDEIAQLTKHDTNDADAYQLALLGDYFLEKQNGERRDNLKKSLEYYQKAVEKDPNFARAYIGISEFYISDGDPKTPVLDRVAKAKAAVLRALELDNGLAEAHIAFAELKYQYEFDWTGAGTEFERAVELKPNDPYFHLAHFWYLMCQERFDDAKRELDRAQELTPGSIRLNKAQGVLLLFRREYEKAISHYQKIREVDPSSIHRNQFTMSVAYQRMGLYKEAVEEFLEDGRIRGFLDPEESDVLRKAFKQSGWPGFERTRIDLLEQKSKKKDLPPTLLAGVYALANEKDAAFAWLEKAIDARDGWVALIKVQPAYDNLRTDPRFSKLLARMNLTP